MVRFQKENLSGKITFWNKNLKKVMDNAISRRQAFCAEGNTGVRGGRGRAQLSGRPVWLELSE